MSASIFKEDATPATVGEVMRGEKIFVSENKQQLPTIEVMQDNLFFGWNFSRFFFGKFGDGACIGFTIKEKKVAFYFGLEKQPEERYTEFLVSIQPDMEGYTLQTRNAQERERLDLLIGAMVNIYRTAPKFTLRFADAKGYESFRFHRAWKLELKIL